jgi:hypothetical protein
LLWLWFPAAAGLAAISSVIYYCKGREPVSPVVERISQRLPELSLRTQMKIKHLGATLQLLPLLAPLALTYPHWFRNITGWLRELSLPIALNAPCYEPLLAMPSVAQGLLALAFQLTLVAFLANAHIIFKRFRDNKTLGSSFFVKCQVFACLISNQVMVSVLPLIFNYHYVMDSGIDLLQTNVDSFDASKSVGPIVNILLCMGLTGVLDFLDRKWCDYVTSKFSKEWKRFIDSGDAASVESLVDQRLVFFSSFCLPYVPGCINFEKINHTRKGVLIIVPRLLLLGNLLAIGVGSTASTFWSDPIRAVLGIDQNNFEMVLIILTTLLFQGTQVAHRITMISRPFVSCYFRKDKVDDVHEVDFWSEQVYSVTLGVIGFTNGYNVMAGKTAGSGSGFTNVLCVSAMLWLSYNQARLFSKHLKSIGSPYGAGEANSTVVDSAVPPQDPTIEEEVDLLVEQLLDASDVTVAFDLRRQIELLVPRMCPHEASRWTMFEEGDDDLVRFQMQQRHAMKTEYNKEKLRQFNVKEFENPEAKKERLRLERIRIRNDAAKHIVLIVPLIAALFWIMSSTINVVLGPGLVFTILFAAISSEYGIRRKSALGQGNSSAFGRVRAKILYKECLELKRAEGY